MRADLHVHSIHSGALHYRRAGLRDCYAAPGEVYDAAKAAGMDLVTITDRDTIVGCLRLIEERRDPEDFLTGEEVEASLPDSALKVHINVWGITQRQHAEIARLRSDLLDLCAWLRAERVAFCFNHFVGALPVNVPSVEIYRNVLALFDAIEVRNGAQGRHYNALVAALASGEAARRRPVAFVGGSDAHTLRRVGSTWTEASASSREGFLEEVRGGRTAAGGRVRTSADIVMDLASLTLSHYAALGDSFRGHGDGSRPPGRELLRAAAALPVQAIGAPLVGTVLYLLGVRAQVRALQREIGSLDLREFRERMNAFRA